MQPHNRTQAPNWCVSEATDADEHAHNLRDWQQKYDQISAGHFYGRIDEIAFPRLQMFREHTSQALHQQCNVWPDSVWLGFAVGNDECRINGERVTASELMCRPGNCHFELVTPEAFDIYGIVVSQEALLTTADIQGIDVDARLLSAPRRQWDSQKLNALRYILQRMLAPMHTGVAGSLQQDFLLTTVLDVLQQNAPDDHAPSAARRRAVVERVRDYLAAHPHEAVTITDLCELAHVSRRTLQYSFESVLGISPLRYLRLSRLNNVRRALLAGLEDGQTISSVAGDWGFWHAGQFAHDYKQLFGENPSETLRRGLS
ncbi:helix-turn-helix domain-containing protein [Thalassolituus sp. LLYu03]|uniref:helix-turn-helix domain-containing protein n=1 Tax=Thalassolituus sp. LLYu03 TaxID=3421656 RepID=UPI003D2A4320